MCHQPGLVSPTGLNVTPNKSRVTGGTRCHQAHLVSLMGPSATDQTSCHQRDSVSPTGLGVTQGIPLVLGPVSGAISVPMPVLWPINGGTAPPCQPCSSALMNLPGSSSALGLGGPSSSQTPTPSFWVSFSPLFVPTTDSNSNRKALWGKNPPLARHSPTVPWVWGVPLLSGGALSPRAAGRGPDKPPPRCSRCGAAPPAPPPRAPTPR